MSTIEEKPYGVFRKNLNTGETKMVQACVTFLGAMDRAQQYEDCMDDDGCTYFAAARKKPDDRKA